MKMKASCPIRFPSHLQLAKRREASQVPSRRFNEVEKGQQIEREEGAEGTKTE